MRRKFLVLSFEFPLPPDNAYGRQLVITVQSAVAVSVEELTATVAWSCLEYSKMSGDKALGAAEFAGDLVDTRVQEYEWRSGRVLVKSSDVSISLSDRVRDSRTGGGSPA